MPGLTYASVTPTRLPQPAGRVRQSRLTDTTTGSEMSERGRSTQSQVTRAGDDRARRSFLSPKEHWSPDASSPSKAVPKYQLRDPGAVPGSPPLSKRNQMPGPTSISGPPLTRSSNTSKSSKWAGPTSTTSASNTTRNAEMNPPPSSIASRGSRGVPIPSGLPQPQPYVHPTARPVGARDYNHDELDSPVSNAATVATASPGPECHPAPPTFERESIALPPTRTSSAIRHMRDVQVWSTSSLSVDGRSTSSTSSTSSDSAPRSGLITPERDMRDSQTRPTSSGRSSCNSSCSGPRSTLITPERSVSPPASETSETDMTLIWQPDPEQRKGGPDAAEELWREIELRLGSHRGRARPLPHPDSIRAERERGQWVLTPRHGGSGRMEKTESEFSVSAYFDPDMTTPRPPTSQASTTGRGRPMQGTAMFDMSAPLVHSRSNDAVTPVNTPLLRPETIQRKSRVEKAASRSRKSDQSVNNSSRSNSTDSLDCLTVPANDRGGPEMYRLDSHVVAALQAFSQTETSITPHLDTALSVSSSSSGPESIIETFIDGGLGLGIQLGSIYSTPVASPPMSSSQRASRLRSISGLSVAIQKGKGKEVTSVKDLDTGLRRDMTVHRLNGVIRV